MIDINKKNNFEQLPPLKQKCDPNVAAKPIQSNSNKTTDIASRISRNYIGDQIRINAQLNARKTASPNAVCIANQNFFLVSAFKDQNFLKKECELARSQVVSKANRNEPKLESSGSHGDGASVSCHNEDMINNNNNNNTANSETKPQSTLIKGRRISNGHQMRTSPIPSLIANGSAVGIANTYNVLPKITKVPSCNTKLKAIQPTDGYRTTTRVTSSTGSKALMNQSSGPAKFTQKASTVRSASRIIPNNNNMQHQQCLDLHDEDIKYIDSDEVITNAESSSMNCQQRCCSQQVEQKELSGKPKARPKSTIICSTNQKNQMFEKVNSYKFAAGTSLADVNARNGIDAVGSVERRRLAKASIDSSSIKASIEKFNSLSEQKRIPLSTNPLRTQTSGCGSTSNLQHHRYSSDFSDNHNVRLPSSVIGGGSLTRTTSRSVAAASPVNKVVTNLYATASSSSTSASPVTVKTRLYSVGNQSNASTRINGVCNNKSTESSPTHMPPKVLNRYDRLKDIKDNDNDGNFVSPNSVPAVVNGKESPATSKTDAADIAESNENRLLNSSCDIDDSARSSSSLRSALPPPSPTPSRYWDRESNRTSSLSRSEDQSKSEKCDEKAEGLCGLRNIGNTCFMNSVIQCLSHTSELTKFLKTQNGVKSSSSSKDQQILYEFAKLIREMWTTNVHSVTPMELKRAFSTKHRMYSDYNQQDAQEFLRFFLDSLHGALNTGVKGEHLKIDDNLSDNKKADLTWEWYARHENSLIRDLFVGQLKSTLKCTTCGNTSVTFDPFWDLSVSLPSSSRCKLDACLDLFIREEILDGDEMPTCSKCQTRRKCTKSFSIQRFPKYLVIHLKRFSETRWSKLSNIVEFPTGEKELNMGPYGSNHNSNVYYSLYAISNHMGSTAGGHYVALCKHPVSKKWHEFNDNIVSDDLSENHLVSSSAYILFYERA